MCVYSSTARVGHLSLSCSVDTSPYESKRQPIDLRTWAQSSFCLLVVLKNPRVSTFQREGPFPLKGHIHEFYAHCGVAIVRVHKLAPRATVGHHANPSRPNPNPDPPSFEGKNKHEPSGAERSTLEHCRRFQCQRCSCGRRRSGAAAQRHEQKYGSVSRSICSPILDIFAVM